MLYFENNPARNIFLCMKSCYICLQKQLEHCFIYFLWNIGCCVFKMSYPSWSACVGKLVNTESYIKSIALFLHKSRFFLFYYIEWKKNNKNNKNNELFSKRQSRNKYTLCVKSSCLPNLSYQKKLASYFSCILLMIIHQS